MSRAKGMVRRGSFTSPAMKVMAFQASAEKRLPVCTTRRAVRKGRAAPSPAMKGAWEGATAGFRNRPRRMRAARPPILATVKRSWMREPRRTP